MKRILLIVMMVFDSVLVMGVSGCGHKEGKLIVADSDTSPKGNVDRTIASEETDDPIDTVWVYVCGAVHTPGVYEVAAGSRIYEVIELAGDFLEDADRTSVNLVECVSDGQMIRIYSIAGEDNSGAVTSSGKVNLNTAGCSELMTLPGIGESKANDIIQYRKEHGFFRKVEDIMNVPGIKEGMYKKIRDFIVL